MFYLHVLSIFPVRLNVYIYQSSAPIFQHDLYKKQWSERKRNCKIWERGRINTAWLAKYSWHSSVTSRV